MTKVVSEARRLNEAELDKRQRYLKANAALKAKLEFIESQYDYSSSAKQLSLSDFQDLIQSNLGVN